MRKTIYECDGICGSCDSCVYDANLNKMLKHTKFRDYVDDLPRHKRSSKGRYDNSKKGTLPSRKIDESKYCNGCPYLAKVYLEINGTEANWRCDHEDNGSMNGRMIGYRISDRALVQKQVWCPLNGTDNSNTKHRTKADLRLAWRNLDPITPFDNIKVRTWYHVPPVLDKNRCDIYVISKDKDRIEFRKRGENTYFTDYLYKHELQTKFLVELKKK